jgi:hypothetical protein
LLIRHATAEVMASPTVGRDVGHRIDAHWSRQGGTMNELVIDLVFRREDRHFVLVHSQVSAQAIRDLPGAGVAETDQPRLRCKRTNLEKVPTSVLSVGLAAFRCKRGEARR